MKLIGCMAVRNEAWCLGLTLRAALQWCDEMVVLDHASTDKSFEIALKIAQECGPQDGSYGSRVTLLGEGNPRWDEMRHRQTMLEAARERGATHIAIIDCDEILAGNLLPEIRAMVEATPKGVMLELPGYNLRGSIDRYHSNGLWGRRWFSTAFADDPRLNWSGDKFHSRTPDGWFSEWKKFRPITQGNGGAMHLWGVSERRLRARHALYKCVERLRWPERPVADIELMYNDWRSPEDNFKHWQIARYREPWTFADVPAEWWEAYAYWKPQPHVDIDAEPWQEQVVRELVGEHGAETFAGLDLFGVA